MTQVGNYRVELDAYSGPLDLLLLLVKRQEIDLDDIPMAELTEQYLYHLKLIEVIDVDRAGDFLVMAATLLEIKSQMLLPRIGGGEGETAGPEGGALDAADPRYELVQQLLAYKRFKDAAIDLEDRLDDWQRRFAARPAQCPKVGNDPEPLEIALEDVDVLDLCQAFWRIVETIGQNPKHEIVYDDTPIALYEQDIVDRLQRDAPLGTMTLEQIFEGRSGRGELIGLFLALLELVRQRKVRLRQERIDQTITISLRSEEAGPAEFAPVSEGEIEYEWPSEEARLYAERRAQRRAERLAALRSGEKMGDDPVLDLDEEPEESAAEGKITNTEGEKSDS